MLKHEARKCTACSAERVMQRQKQKSCLMALQIWPAAAPTGQHAAPTVLHTAPTGSCDAKRPKHAQRQPVALKSLWAQNATHRFLNACENNARIVLKTTHAGKQYTTHRRLLKTFGQFKQSKQYYQRIYIKELYPFTYIIYNKYCKSKN